MPEHVPLSSLAEVNPALSAALPGRDGLVSFIPMADVSEDGRWTNRQTRRVSEIGAGYTPFQEGDVLFAKITPCMENGKGCLAHGLVNGIGYGSTEFHVLRAKDENDPRFVFYWSCLPELRQKAEAYMTGSAGQRRVAAEFFDKFYVPPLAPDAQSGAATVLAQVDAAIVHTERTITKLKKIKTGLLRDLLTRGIDANGELRDPRRHPEQFHEVPGFGLAPRGWDPKKLSDLGSWQGGITPRKSNLKFWHEGTIAWVTPKDMRGAILSESEDRLTPFAVDTCKMAVFGTDCVTVVFRSGVLRHSFPVAMCAMPFTVNQDMKVLTPGEDVFGVYAFYLMHLIERRVLQLAVKVGTTVESVDGEVFYRMGVALPRLDEQRAIAARLEALDSRLRSEAGSLAKLRLIKHGLMQDLLSGRKRVPAELIGERTDEQTGGGTQREANIYFRRAVLAAEIVQQFHDLPTFGSVKFQKALFLCERVAGLDLGTRYHRAAAGPHDNRLMRSVDSQLERQRWFRKVPREQGANGNPTGWRYEPMENAGGHRQYFDQYWTEVNDRIQRVLDVLRRLNSERCEIVATLYSAWEDLLAAGDPPSDDAIVDEVLTNWHESKQAISRDRWMAALGWIREQGLTPEAAGGGAG